MKRTMSILVMLLLTACIPLLSACKADNSPAVSSSVSGLGADSTPTESISSEINSQSELASGTDGSSEEVSPISYDLDGNEVSSDLFSQKKLTMVNLWATFCGPCIREMPELGEISGEYADKDFQIVGIVADVVASDGSLSQKQVALAIEIVAQTKATYLHLLPTAEVYTLLPDLVGSTSVPTTLFIDRNGKPVGEAILGSKDKASWEKIIDEKLSSLEESQ